jgi:inosine-uridine nucleoside N-ribohydrolase
MKMFRFLLLLLIASALSPDVDSQTRIIFDTDFGGDADDLGALSMLHTFMDLEECELLAVMCWSTEQYAVSAIDAVNHYYGHPDIPVGARKDSITFIPWNYCKVIAEQFPFELDHHKVPDAVVLYRKILAESQDKSVVIVTVGPLKNIENLLFSGGDSLSALKGRELVSTKVKEFVVMGGNFPEGKWEWNFAGGMPGVTQNVLSNIEVPVTFTGFELGVQIRTGQVFNHINVETPLYAGFLHFSKNAPWMKRGFQGEILDNSTFDQTAVLYAVRNGTGTYWEKVSGGICIPDEKGGNIWKEDRDSRHSYLRLIKDPEELATIIEKLMLGDLQLTD